MTTTEGNPVDDGHSLPDAGVALDSNGVTGGNAMVDVKTEAPSSPKKRARTNSEGVEGATDTSVKRVKGVAPIKAEYATPPT